MNWWIFTWLAGKVLWSFIFLICVWSEESGALVGGVHGPRCYPVDLAGLRLDSARG